MRYRHNLKVDNDFTSPKIIIPLVFEYLKPSSVVDIGCGTGRFLKIFKEMGVDNVLGIDGPWVNKELLYENIKENEFEEIDLQNRNDDFHKDRKFDLCICLEVVEHLPREKANFIIKNLVSLSDNILFSAALPGQGGQNHINEQPIEFWIKIFKNHNYIFLDLFRRKLWDNELIQPWFPQNLYLVVKDDSQLARNYQSFKDIFLANAIHPNQFRKKVDLLNKYANAKLPFQHYVKLAVLSIINSLRRE